MKLRVQKTLAVLFLAMAGLSLHAQIGNYNPNAGTIVVAPGGSGGATPGCFVPLPTQQSGQYYFTYTTSGASLASSVTMSATASGSTMSSYSAGTPFYFNGNNISMNVTVASNAQFCTTEVINYTIYRYTGFGYSVYCGYTLTVICRDQSKDNFIVQSSGMYYATNDFTIDRQYWDPNLGWQYEDISPVGGWGSIQVDGWLASADYNTDQIFFKGRDMKVYNLFKSGGLWYVGLLNASANNVAGCIRYRQDGLFYLGTDGKVYHLYWSSGWQFEAIAPWSGWTASAYVSPGINLFSGPVYTGEAMELAPWPASNIYFRSTNNKIYNLVGSTGSWGLGQISPSSAVDCGGDMVTDNTGLYYRGTDNYVHKLYWNSTWVYDPMTTSNLSTGNTEGHLSKFPGENRVFYRGTDSHLYNIYLNGSTWDVFPLDYGVNTVAGDVLCSDWKVYFVSTDNRVHNFWWSGSAWVDNALMYSIANAKGCSSNYRSANPEAPKAEASSSLKLYPNPASGLVSFTYEGAAPVQYSLYSVAGQLVRSEAITGDQSTGLQLDISALPKGVYLFVAEFNDGHKETQRLVTQ